MIRIKKYNQSFVKLECEDYIKAELNDFFTFMAKDGWQYGKNKRKGWDGKLRLFKKQKSLLPYGLLNYLYKFCQEKQYKMSFETHDIYLHDEVSEEEIKKYAKSLKLCSKGRRIVLHDYQATAIVKALRARKKLLLSPTASGKSLIMYIILRWLLKNKKLNKFLIVVPTISLVNQLFTDFEDYSSENGFNVEKHFHKIFEGQPKLSDKLIYISTWQSIYELTEDYFSQFNMVMVDECHLASAKSLSGIMEKSINSEYRIGLTGSLNGSECFDENTLIKTETVDKKISDIKIGDKILSFNEITKKLEYKPVLNIYNRIPTTQLYKIFTENGNFICTENHKIYTNRGWIEAKNLTIDDILYGVH